MLYFRDRGEQRWMCCLRRFYQSGLEGGCLENSFQVRYSIFAVKISVFVEKATRFAAEQEMVITTVVKIL